MPKGRQLFTPEQATWVRVLYPKHGAAETARLMNAWFGTDFTARQVAAGATRRGSWLTPEVKAWLREHIHERSLPGTAEELYRVFGIRVRVGQLNSANSNHKLGRANRNVIRAYSEDEFDWLKENLPTAPRDEIADRFLERFGREISHSKLDNFVSRHGCQGAPNIGGFKKGHVSHNKGRKGWSAPGTEATRFKKGHINNVEHPMYTERWRIVGSQKARTLFIKVPGPDPYRRDFPSHFKYHWIRKAVWVWEQANGPVPKGHAVVQLDGDPANCKPENLDCVPQAVLARLNAYHAPAYAGPDANPARVRIAQIKEAIATR